MGVCVFWVCVVGYLCVCLLARLCVLVCVSVYAAVACSRFRVLVYEGVCVFFGTYIQAKTSHLITKT